MQCANPAFNLGIEIELPTGEPVVIRPTAKGDPSAPRFRRDRHRAEADFSRIHPHVNAGSSVPNLALQDREGG